MQMLDWILATYKKGFKTWKIKIKKSNKKTDLINSLKI
jgi:hypothetical protein